MATFEYIGRTKSGEKVGGKISAPDRQHALLQIDRMGHLPVSVTEIGADAAKQAAAEAFNPFRSKRMKTREVLQFTTELSDLLGSGMQLGQALGVLSNRKTGKAGDTVIPELREAIMQGASLSEAMAEHPKSFPTLYSSLIKAGEASGALPEVLMRLVEHYERVQKTKEQVTMAMVYPAFVMVMGGAIIIFLLTNIIPRFESIFEELGSSLPASTKLLQAISEGFLAYGWIFILAGVGIGFSIYRFVQTEVGRKKRDRLVLSVPVVKNIVAASSFSQFARTFATLLANGVHALPALKIVESTLSNVIIVEEIQRARAEVTDGTSISGPLAQGGVFPPMLTDMLAVGEETGNIANSLQHIANRYEAELDRSIKMFTTVLEPTFLLFIAVVVGFVAFSIFGAVQAMTDGLG